MARSGGAGGALPPGKPTRPKRFLGHFASPAHPQGGAMQPGTALASLGHTRRGAPLRSLTRAGLHSAVTNAILCGF